MNISEDAIRNCILGSKCEADWQRMMIVRRGDESEDGDLISEIRFCKDCQKEVYQCNFDEELIKNIKLNRCVRVSTTPWSAPLMGRFVLD